MTLAARLVLLVALALLPPLAIQAWTGVEQRRDREADLRIQAVAQTRAVQADVTRVADGVHQVLATLATVPAIRNGDALACTAFLLEVASQFRDYALLAATGTDGSIICTSTGTAKGSFSNTGRAFFQRAVASGGFAAGDVVVGIVTGRRSIHFALPFHRADGALGGLVLASVDQDRLERLLVAEALPPGALAFVLDPSGTVVAAVQDNRPVTAGWIGQPAPETLRAALRTPGPVEATGPDGRPRLFGAVPPDPDLGGIVVAVALDQARALTDLQAATRHNLIGILLGLVLALGAGAFGARRFVLTPLARLADAADRVGRGELGARADLGAQAGELEGVGAAFNRMSAALAVREGERDRARTAQQAGEARVARLLA
ncbi:MAG: HAMP domain-containing protein, partial [Janthinobacterium lividum]